MLLTTGLLLSWTQGARAWMAIRQRADLTSDAQIALRRIERLLESSASASVAIDSSCLSFASSFGLRTSLDSDRSSVSTDLGSLQWQKFVLFYLDAPARRILLREIPIAAGLSAYQQATPIPQVDFGSGVQPLAFYRTAGSKFCSSVDAFSATQSGLILTIHLEMSEADRKASFQSSTRLRN